MIRRTFSRTNTSRTLIGIMRKNASSLSFSISLLLKYPSGTGIDVRKMKLVPLCQMTATKIKLSSLVLKTLD